MNRLMYLSATFVLAAACLIGGAGCGDDDDDATCGDGKITGSEKCDDGDSNSYDGCNSLCQIEHGFACSGEPSTCATTCGDGAVAGGEACDDGNTAAGDGCDATCKPEHGYTCSGDPSVCSSTCGDGILAGASEHCDDGNTAAGDGCDASCGVEHGYDCSGEPSTCAATCGDGKLAASEECDDGGTATGDGCDAACAEEPGYVCTGEPSVCAATCGDGIITAGEECDDHDLENGNGCDDNCETEHGYECTGMPSTCVSTCGDGLLASNEGCDDGGTATGDGCGATCAPEAGWDCDYSEPSICATVCGDGILIAGKEECDDHNAIDLDGCNHLCKVDVFDEAEPNDTHTAPDGPFNPGFIVHGSISPATDVDVFAVNVSAISDIRIETFDDNGRGVCNNIDTTVTLFAPDGTTVVASDDDGGVGRCSLVAPATAVGAARLAPGTYYVAVKTFQGYKRIPAYGLVVELTAVCGDGKTAGSEECDGGAGCEADCERVPECGDGFVDGSEQCDDRGTVAGDGCSASCAYEQLDENEPNDTSAQAGAVHVPNLLLGGAISPATDVDFFAIELNETADLRVETFDATGPGHCTGIDTVLTLVAGDGTTTILQRDQGGLNGCSLIDSTRASDTAARHLPAGTYFLKVQSFLSGSSPGYTILVTTNALCGDGAVQGAEECEGLTGCSETCNRVASCGDKLVDAPETCDDGNGTSGDGCSAACVAEVTSESEANDTAATADGPVTPAPTAIVSGGIAPATDVDFYAVTLTATSDLTLSTSGGALDVCGIDSLVTFYGTDGTTVLATNDNVGSSFCSELTAKNDLGVRHLAPGTYFVSVEESGKNSLVTKYHLSVTVDALCGNGKTEGFEECDGGAGCDASCDRVPTCGDGELDAAETCDDGGTTAGDGCSATCQLEVTEEVEPNDTTAGADANAAVAGTAMLHGAIAAAGDKDLTKLTVLAPTLVRFETFDGPQSCSVATTLRLLGSDGTVLYSDDNSGIGACSGLSVFLAAGTYYAQVEERGNDGTLASYFLSIDFGAVDLASESEPNEVRSAADTMAGADVYILGNHQAVLDTDFYAITVPAGKSVRAELIEGGAETCESNDIDSLITLYNGAGVALGDDDDGGRGYCSLIDGTGAAPAQAFASKLGAGVYFVSVEASPFAESQNGSSAKFDYRLVVVVR